MNWGMEDFIAAAALLSLAVVAVVLVRQHVKGRMQRVALIVVIVLAFLAVWAELAVGIFH
jgi:hypothetical protein